MRGTTYDTPTLIGASQIVRRAESPSFGADLPLDGPRKLRNGKEATLRDELAWPKVGVLVAIGTIALAQRNPVPDK